MRVGIFIVEYLAVLPLLMCQIVACVKFEYNINHITEDNRSEPVMA